MVVTFPHMGTMSITLKTLFTGLGAQVQVPPPISKKTVELGSQYAPETVCLPFKVMLGNFIEALDQGADTLVTCGGVGPCRLGYYAEIQKGILEDLGYNFEIITIEPNLINVISSIRRVAEGKSIKSIYHAFRLAGAKMAAIDRGEEQVRLMRPYVERQETVDIVWKRFLFAVEQAGDTAAVNSALDRVSADLMSIPADHGRNPLRIAIVGEIYVMLESFINQNIDRTLSELGVEVHKTMSLTEYVYVHLFKNKEYLQGYQHILRSAKPYLGHYVGGHGIKTVGCAAQATEAGYDGVIQVFPFTCMPEVIAKNILPSVISDTGIPVLSLTFDEQSGEAGIRTRLEAYIDLLRYNRLKKCL